MYECMYVYINVYIYACLSSLDSYVHVFHSVPCESTWQAPKRKVTDKEAFEDTMLTKRVVVVPMLSISERSIQDHYKTVYIKTVLVVPKLIIDTFVAPKLIISNAVEPKYVCCRAQAHYR